MVKVPKNGKYDVSGAIFRMPIENTESGLLFSIKQNSKRIKLGKVKEIQILERDSCERQEKSSVFNVKWEWHSSIDAVYFLAYCKFPSNNWRRMHGYRPRRKKR